MLSYNNGNNGFITINQIKSIYALHIKELTLRFIYNLSYIKNITNKIIFIH